MVVILVWCCRITLVWNHPPYVGRNILRHYELVTTKREEDTWFSPLVCKIPEEKCKTTSCFCSRVPWQYSVATVQTPDQRYWKRTIYDIAHGMMHHRADREWRSTTRQKMPSCLIIEMLQKSLNLNTHLSISMVCQQRWSPVNIIDIWRHACHEQQMNFKSLNDFAGIVHTNVLIRHLICFRPMGFLHFRIVVKPES